MQPDVALEGGGAAAVGGMEAGGGEMGGGDNADESWANLVPLEMQQELMRRVAEI